MVTRRPARLVGEGPSGVVGAGYAAQTVVNGGSGLLIFVLRAGGETTARK